MMQIESRHRRVAILLLSVLVFGSAPSLAEESASDPERAAAETTEQPTQVAHALVSEIIDLVLAELSKQGVEKEAKIKALESIVFSKFDFATISRLVLARNYKRLTKVQRREFQELFKAYLSDFYGSRLVDYVDEKVEVKGARLEERGDVTVMTKVIGGDVDGIAMHYRVRNRKGSWKVIDVTIEGVSTVSNFRSQFKEIMIQGGPEKLLETLREKNYEDANTE